MNISVFNDIRQHMQKLHELEMQLIQIENQSYDILLKNYAKAVNSDINSVNIHPNVNVSPFNTHHDVNANKSITNVPTDNSYSYQTRYTSIKDPKIMKKRTYNISDSDEIEYISKVYDMK